MHQLSLSPLSLFAAILIALPGCSGDGKSERVDNDAIAEKNSNLASYECQLDADKAKGVHPTRFIFNTKTGKNYKFDDFSQKLVVWDGFVGSGFGDEEVRIKNHIKSALVDDIWKWKHELGLDVIVERHVNLKTLEYRQFTTSRYQSTDLKGKCKQVPIPDNWHRES